MNVLWNKKDLDRPANNIWVASRRAIDFKKFVFALESIIKDLDSQNALHMEAAILSRLIYRMKSKFRSDKGLKNMEKVNRALLNYLEINLLKEYKDLRNYVEPDGLVVNLPTKQMVEYVLVRTQGFAKLMCRIENVAKSAAQFFKGRITIGHAWTVSVIAYAVVSRIWYLSRYLLKRCCSWYNSIYEHVVKFRQIGPTWLPENYDLPSNLKTWLDLPWIDQATDSVPLEDDGKETIFSLIKAQIDDPCESTFETEDIDSPEKNVDDSVDISQDTSKIDEGILRDESTPSAAKLEASYFADDIGMSISREDFQSQLRVEESNSQESVESKENLKRKTEDVTDSKNDTKILAKTKTKKRKKLLKTDDKNCKGKKEKNGSKLEFEEEKTTLKMSKLKLTKAVKKSSSILAAHSSSPDKKRKDLKPHDIKTRDDLMTFLNKDSYPGLDRLQWNMLINSVKKFVARLEKCGPSDEKKQKILLKKVNSQIQNWIK